MKWLAPSVLFAAVCAASPVPGHAEDVKLVTPEQMKWVAFEPIPGTQITVLSGDPAKAGQFVIEWGGPAGIKVPPHWHSIIARVTMISGTGMLAMGDNLDLKKGTPLGYWRILRGARQNAPLVRVYKSFRDDDRRYRPHR